MIDTFALARSPFLEASTVWLQGWGAGKTVSVPAWDLVGEDSESIRLKRGGLETLLLACSAHLQVAAFLSVLLCPSLAPALETRPLVRGWWEQMWTQEGGNPASRNRCLHSSMPGLG